MPITRRHILAKRAELETECPSFFVAFEGRIFECFVLSQDLEPALQQFAFQMVAGDFEFQVDRVSDINEVTLFGVADTVPEEFRPFVIQHEMMEYLMRCCCDDAAKYEINRAEKNLDPGAFIDYLNMRRDFFRSLIPYAETHEGYTPKKIAEFRLSLSAFERACGGV